MNVVPLFESPAENNLNTPNLKGSDGGGVGLFLFAEGTLHYAALSFFYRRISFLFANIYLLRVSPDN